MSDAGSTDAAEARSVLRLLTSVTGRRDDAIAIVNGLFGDAFDERGSNLAIPMTIRAGDTVLPLDRYGLAGALAAANVTVGPRVCILVHGLMSTESIWRFPSRFTGEPNRSYGARLTRDHGVTTLAVRYNTGRHISTNGRELALLLDQLLRAWPVRVREINLIGHSMGGLVVRSACHYGRRPFGRRWSMRRRWTGKVRRVVLIGVPNTGAGLEALVNSASGSLGSIPGPVTRLLGNGLDRRSAGIKDLRFGAILDDDWIDADPAARARPHPHRPLRLRRARYLVVAGTLTTDPEHPIARSIGDALVTHTSATGIVDDGELFRDATTRVFPRVGHIRLAHHPDVEDTITSWW
ncbi:MAG TPA: alpha/beta fold hydrolase [Ilumatobacter sp.]|nr:alpha/beta fold hydrolase [Ilumatobacter sp.]